MSPSRRTAPEPPRDPDLVGAEAAMRRAARRARERAARAGRPYGPEPGHDPRAPGFSGAWHYEALPGPREPTTLHEARPAVVEDIPGLLELTTFHEEGHALVDALGTLRDAGLDGCASHLREAAERINENDWAGAVRESLHAVESVARQLDPGASRGLEPALKSIEKQGGTLHPALVVAFGKLYGYASDEQGVRHPLLDRTDSRVDRDLAVFMLGACASFASYLQRKHAAREGA